MSGIELFQAVTASVYLLTLSAVGGRLLFLAYRNRSLPELLLGGALLVGGTIGASLEGASVAAMSAAIEAGTEVATAPIAGRMMLAGKLAGIVAVALQAVFVYRVFRPSERWPIVAMGLLVATVVTSSVAFWMHGCFAGADMPTSWVLIEFVGRIGGPVWMGIESARYYGMMKRRLKLGLANPIVTNRFFLWSLSTVFSTLLLCTSVPPSLLDPMAYKSLLLVDLFVFSVAGVATSLLYCLAFFPPASYRQRVQKLAGVEA